MLDRGLSFNMKERALKDIPLRERKQILLELQVLDSASVREKHRISNQTISHIRFHHGKPKPGYYNKDLLVDEVNPVIIQIADLHQQGLNSLQIAGELNMPLERVNAVWDEVVKVLSKGRIALS